MIDEDITASIVVALRSGSREAASALESGYRKPLERFAQRYLNNRDDAEDLVQEVFLKVLDAETVPENFRAWIYRVARNACLNRQRSRQRRKDGERIPTRFEMPRETLGLVTRLEKEEEVRELQEKLESLSSEHQEVLYLRYQQSLSRSEIASVIGLPESVVKSRLFEAVKKLRPS